MLHRKYCGMDRRCDPLDPLFPIHTLGVPRRDAIMHHLFLGIRKRGPGGVLRSNSGIDGRELLRVSDTAGTMVLNSSRPSSGPTTGMDLASLLGAALIESYGYLALGSGKIQFIWYYIRLVFSVVEIIRILRGYLPLWNRQPIREAMGCSPILDRHKP